MWILRLQLWPEKAFSISLWRKEIIQMCILYYSFDMKKYVVSVHGEEKPFKYQVFDYSCDKKKHVVSVHEEDKQYK